MSVFRQLPSLPCAYRVKVKHGKWQGFDRARLEISVGQPYHEGEKFGATLDWVKERFPDTVLLVNDTLQRFNLMFEERIPEDVAERIALEMGTEWIERNVPPGSSFPLMRWNDWREREDYREIYDQSLDLFERNGQFRAALLDSIEEVWARRNTKYEAYSSDRKDEFFRLSISYLIEETAVLAMAYKEFPGVSVYPGSFHEMWSMFLDTEIEGAPEGLKNVHCVRIDFARNKVKHRSDNGEASVSSLLLGSGVLA